MQSSTATRVALSFFALIVGWITGYGSFCIIQLTSGFHRITDFEAMMVYPLFFILLGWAVFVIPLVTNLSPQSRLYSPVLCPLVGIIGTHLVFFVLVGWWLPFQQHWQYLVYLTVMGLVGGAAFSIILRTRLVQSSQAVPVFLLSPLILAIIFTFIVWHFSRFSRFTYVA